MQVLALFGALFAAFVFAVAVVIAFSHGARQRERARLQLWSEWARAQGGFFLPPQGGGWVGRGASVIVPHRHVSVILDTYLVSANKTSVSFTRARARLPLGFGPGFRVEPAGTRPVGRPPGEQDVALGDPAFDARFVLRAEAPALVRLAWTAAARAASLAFAAPSIRSDGVEVSAVVRGAVATPHELEALRTIVGELASYRLGELAELARATDAVFDLPPGAWDRPAVPVLRWSTARGEVEAGLTREGLAVRIADARGLPELRAGLVGGKLTGLPAGLVSGAASALLPLVGRCELITSPGLLWIRWPDVPDPAALRAGVRLLGELASDASGGAFR